MDPDITLDEAIKLAETIIRKDEEEESVSKADAVELAEKLLALNSWMAEGGFLPRMWKISDRQVIDGKVADVPRGKRSKNFPVKIANGKVMSAKDSVWYVTCYAVDYSHCVASLEAAKIEAEVVSKENAGLLFLVRKEDNRSCKPEVAYRNGAVATLIG